MNSENTNSFPAPPTKWSLDTVAQKLAALSPMTIEQSEQSEEQTSPIVRALRKAAAVVLYFEPYKLIPYGYLSPATDEAALEQLLDNSTLAYDEKNQPRWTLKLEIRRTALKELIEWGELTEAIETSRKSLPDSLKYALQDALLACCSGNITSLGEQNLEQLTATLTAVEWLDQITQGLPSRDGIARRIERHNLLKPFHHLVGEHFRGRAAELQTLRDYVGVLPADSVYQSVRRSIENIFSLHEKPPLLIHGPGGMGKSTLVAKFILEHAQLAAENLRLPFAYIDFDRPGLLVQEPLTILLEAVKQLGSQFPHVSSWCDELRARWLKQLAEMSENARPFASSSNRQNRRQSFGSIRNRGRFLDEFTSLVNDLKKPNVPLLLVLDTFEEAQYRSRHSIEELWKFLNELQGVVPRLRTVLAGRAPVTEFKTQNLSLGNLDEEATRGFLNYYGVSDQELTQKVFRQIGGNPLSLRLAASVLERETAGNEGVQDLTTRRFFFLSLQDNLIQGQLYKRILGHIHNPDVRRLAHPGLVLRRLTPELIERVLAEPCGVIIQGNWHAQELFEEFRREVSLVSPSDDGALRHRPDVRRVMLELLNNDEPQKVAEIHRRTADFYREQPGAVARAEEIYHLLALGTDTQTVDALWMEGVELYLHNAVEELPITARPFLASRLGIDIDEQIWQQADLESWERRVERQAEELLVSGNVEAALKILRERTERSPASPLFALEAQAAESLQMFDEAKKIIEVGIRSISEADDSHRLLDLLLISTRLDEKTGDFGTAFRKLRETVQLARNVKNLSAQVVLLTSQLRMIRTGATGDAAVAEQTLAQATDFLRQTSNTHWFALPDLFRSLGSEIGATNPEIFADIIKATGIGKIGNRQKESLAFIFAEWDEQISRAEGSESGVLARRAGLLKKDENLRQPWLNFFLRAETGERDKIIAFALENNSLPAQIAAGLAETIRHEDDDAEPMLA